MTSDTRIVTVADSKCIVAVFSQPAGGVEVVITRPAFGSKEPVKSTKINIPPALDGRRIVTVRHYDGAVEVVYRDIEDE